LLAEVPFIAKAEPKALLLRVPEAFLTKEAMCKMGKKSQETNMKKQGQKQDTSRIIQVIDPRSQNTTLGLASCPKSNRHTDTQQKPC